MSTAQRASSRVRELLERGLFEEPRMDEEAQVAEAVAVVDPDRGELHSWFVPLVTGERLLGFAELSPDLEPIRYSSFGESEQETPTLAEWTDPGTVRSQAAELQRLDETLADPVLTYDRQPSRLAWRVTATDRSGSTRQIFVSGGNPYEERPQSDEPATGG